MMSILTEIGLYHYLILALILFCIALFGLFVCKNLIKLLTCMMMLFNAIGINFVAFAVYCDVERLNGIYFQLFILIIALLELILGGYLIYCIFKYKKSSDVNKTGFIRG